MSIIKNKALKKAGGIALAFALAGISAYLISRALKKDKVQDEKNPEIESEKNNKK